jgi:hypothetical protein
MGECNHEMPGLPYPAFRMMNAEAGGGEPSPYGKGLVGVALGMFLHESTLDK